MRMSQRDHDPSLVEVSSFSLGTDAIVTTSHSEVLLATPSGRIEIIDKTGESSTLSTEGPIEDIAAGKYVFTLVQGTITAYTTTGIELWTRPVEECMAVASLGQAGIVGCVTGDGRLVGLDAETGTELFELERPHGDVEVLNAVIGGKDQIAVAAWSFLTVVNDTGEIVFDENLEGAIKDVALLDGAVVAQLKDGRIMRFSLPDGQQTWSQLSEARAIASYDGEAVVAAGSGGIERIDKHGNQDPLSLPRAETVFATNDGECLITTDGGTQTVYRRGRLPLATIDAEVLTEEVRPGESIRCRISNGSPEHLETSIDLVLTPDDAVELAGQTITVSLDPGEETETAVRVQDVSGSEPVTVTLETDGETLSKGSIVPVKRTDPAQAVDVTTEIDAITGEHVEATLDVTNTAGEDASVATRDGEQTVEAGATATLTIAVPFERGDDPSLSVSVGDETAEIPLSVPTANETPTVTCVAAGTQSNPFLDVVISHPLDATVRDDLQVSTSDGRLDVQRLFELDPAETLRLTVPLTSSFIADGITVTARLNSLDVATETQLTLEDWAETADTEHSSDEPGATGGGSDQPKEDTIGSLITVSREVPQTTQRGERFEEVITVAPDGNRPVEDLELVFEDDSYARERIGATEEVKLRRKHAIFETGPTTLSEGSVVLGDETQPLPDRTVTVQRGPFEVRVTADKAGSDLIVGFECINKSQESYQIEALGVDPTEEDPTVWRLDDPVVLPSGTSETLTRKIEETRHRYEQPISGGVKCRAESGEERHFWTLFRPTTESGPEESVSGAQSESESQTTASPPEAGIGDQPVGISVTPRSSPVAGQNTAIECSLTARVDLSNVSAEASGEIITPLSTGERTIGEIEAGESESYFVDIAPEESGTAVFELSVTASGTGSGIDRVYRIKGPVAADEESADGIETEWVATADGETVSQDGRSSLPDRTDSEKTEDGSETHLVTAFRAVTGNRH